MDPNIIELTLGQKTKAIINGINNVVPIAMIVVIIVALIGGAFFSNLLPVFFASFVWDLLVRRILVGAVFALITYFAVGFTYFVGYEEHFKPFLEKVQDAYLKECDLIKKDILKGINKKTEDSLLR